MSQGKKRIKIDADHQKEKAESNSPNANDETEDSLAAEPDESADIGDEPAESDTVEQKLETATREAADNYERLLRVSADFENYKKRSAREIEDFRKFANQELVKDLLPILDNLDLALKSAPENDKAANGLLEGIELTRREILRVFEKHNVKQIDALGMPFDPSYHEAVMREETDDHPENTVTNELQKGYLMHDRLIRPSMVAVSMPAKKDQPPANGS